MRRGATQSGARDGEMFVAAAHEGNDRAEQFTVRAGERILVALGVAVGEHRLEVVRAVLPRQHLEEFEALHETNRADIRCETTS